MGSNITGATAKGELKRTEIHDTKTPSFLYQHSNLGLVIIPALEALNQVRRIRLEDDPVGAHPVRASDGSQTRHRLRLESTAQVLQLARTGCNEIARLVTDILLVAPPQPSIPQAKCSRQSLQPRIQNTKSTPAFGEDGVPALTRK
jgi:hypothetical protein